MIDFAGYLMHNRAFNFSSKKSIFIEGLNLMFKIIRLVLGSIIAFFDLITRGPKLKRSAEAQQLVETELKDLSIYQFKLCPFCIKTRRTMHKLNLPIELFDAKNDAVFRSELLEQGGKIKVPCLRISEDNGDKWMYESGDIIAYLNSRFQKVEVA